MNASLRTERVDGVLTVAASGVWATGASFERSRGSGDGAGGAAAVDEAERALRAAGVRSVVLRADTVESWDSSLLAVFSRLMNAAGKRGLPVDIGHLPEGMRRLLSLAHEIPARAQTPEQRREPGLLEMVGDKTLAVPGIALHVTAFVGEVAASLGRFCIGRASFSGRDVWRAFRECGVDALPIVSLTSLLLGLILAFVGAIQLRMFGAEVYVAALVGVAMVRVMGPVLTGIVLAGRTGASFAAIIGSMQANEEVDALITFGIAPVDFLVLPRVLGLAIMTPLLAVYADVMGIAGGCVVSVLMLDIAPSAYWENAFANIAPSYVWIGLLHALVFGFVVSLCGCYQGMRSGRNAEAVGRATTAAVVNSIVGIIVSTSIITVIFTVIDL